MSASHDAVRIGLVATSDRASQGVYRDEGIPALEAWLAGALLNPVTFEKRLIPDERPMIEETLTELVDAVLCDLVITTGGTGPAPRDVTPEATLAVAHREMPGFGERQLAHDRDEVPAVGAEAVHPDDGADGVGAGDELDVRKDHLGCRMADLGRKAFTTSSRVSR